MNSSSATGVQSFSFDVQVHLQHLQRPMWCSCSQHEASLAGYTKREVWTGTPTLYKRSEVRCKRWNACTGGSTAGSLDGLQNIQTKVDIVHP